MMRYSADGLYNLANSYARAGKPGSKAFTPSTSARQAVATSFLKIQYFRDFDRGRLIRCDTPAALRTSLAETCYEVQVADRRAARGGGAPAKAMELMRDSRPKKTPDAWIDTLVAAV